MTQRLLSTPRDKPLRELIVVDLEKETGFDSAPEYGRQSGAGTRTVPSIFSPKAGLESSGTRV